MSKPFIIGIAGGSGSGKSTVTNKIVDAVSGAHTAVIVQDNYYRDQSDLTFEQRILTNYDHPRAFDWALMIQQVDDLKQGLPIKMPQYSFTEHTRAADSITIVPATVIVIEGLFALYDAALCDMMSLKIYVDTDQLIGAATYAAQYATGGFLEAARQKSNAARAAGATPAKSTTNALKPRHSFFFLS